MTKHGDEQKQPYTLGILAPREIQAGDTIPLSGVIIEHDWKQATKLDMVESARDLMTDAYKIGSLDPAFPTVLWAIIEGNGLYEYSLGEFFQLYGQFEGKYQLTKGSETKVKMEALLKGEKKYLKPYKDRGKTLLYPLPYAVRNILAHSGQNTNKLDQNGRELRTSIELLRSWVNPKK